MRIYPENKILESRSLAREIYFSLVFNSVKNNCLIVTFTGECANLLAVINSLERLQKLRNI